MVVIREIRPERYNDRVIDLAKRIVNAAKAREPFISPSRISELALAVPQLPQRGGIDETVQSKLESAFNSLGEVLKPGKINPTSVASPLADFYSALAKYAPTSFLYFDYATSASLNPAFESLAKSTKQEGVEAVAKIVALRGQHGTQNEEVDAGNIRIIELLLSQQSPKLLAIGVIAAEEYITSRYAKFKDSKGKLNNLPNKIEALKAEVEAIKASLASSDTAQPGSDVKGGLDQENGHVERESSGQEKGGRRLYIPTEPDRRSIKRTPEQIRRGEVIELLVTGGDLRGNPDKIMAAIDELRNPRVFIISGDASRVANAVLGKLSRPNSAFSADTLARMRERVESTIAERQATELKEATAGKPTVRRKTEPEKPVATRIVERQVVSTEPYSPIETVVTPINADIVHDYGRAIKSIAGFRVSLIGKDPGLEYQTYKRLLTEVKPEAEAFATTAAELADEGDRVIERSGLAEHDMRVTAEPNPEVFLTGVKEYARLLRDGHFQLDTGTNVDLAPKERYAALVSLEWRMRGAQQYAKSQLKAKSTPVPQAA